MRELTPEERAKVARVWVPVAGHLYVIPGVDTEWFRILEVHHGEITRWTDSCGGIYETGSDSYEDGWVPCFWGDHATADGLLRTARAALGLPLLSVAPHPFLARYVVWASPRLSTCWEGPTEPDALLAAILAAPEVPNAH